MLNKFYIVFIALAVFYVNRANAQKYLTPANQLFLKQTQDSLAKLGDSIFFAKKDSTRITANQQLLEKLTSSLKKPYSFSFGFDSLQHISFVKSPDLAFRLITWYLPLQNNTYQFHGYLQMNKPDGSLNLIALNDATASFTNTDTIVNRNHWYGARYFDIIPITAQGKPTYYLLLGWKGNNEKTTKKLIDVLSFEKGEPIFGKKVFEGEKDQPLKTRIVFEYNKQNNMSLNYNKLSKSIIFDHLAPFDPAQKGNFEYYGSDLTFDAYKITYSKMFLQQNVELMNEATSTDEFYIAPVKASTIIPKKIKK